MLYFKNWARIMVNLFFLVALIVPVEWTIKSPEYSRVLSIPVSIFIIWTSNSKSVREQFQQRKVD
jgi:hypothetical protein